MPGRTDFQVGFRGRDSEEIPRDGYRFRLLVIGDFGAREAHGANEAATIAGRKPVLLDPEGLDRCIARFAPRLSLELEAFPDKPVEIGFQGFDDFHPDRVFDRCDAFLPWREMRHRLRDPAFMGAPRPTTASSRPPSASPDTPLAALLGRGPAAGRSPRSGGIDLDAFIRGIVAPHIVPGADPSQAELIAALDEAITVHMRTVMHHPAFKSLESLWTSVHRLVDRLEIGEALEVQLLDVTRSELVEDLRRAAGSPEACGLHRLLVESGRNIGEGTPWSLVVGAYRFGHGEDDARTLGGIAALAAAAGAPFLAEADPSVVGCVSFAAAPDPRSWAVLDAQGSAPWSELRRSPRSSWIGLAAPRVLLRLPYGQRTESIERFRFEELPSPAPHEDYLWGNPAFACAELIAEACIEHGHPVAPGHTLDVEGLPVHAFREDGESRMKPCAEVFLSELAGETMTARGIMPLLSYANRNAVRVFRFQSIADPPAELSGPWS